MNGPPPQPSGSYEPSYRIFLETVATLRPRLHRYCARMTGSVLDGEDVAQDALFRAYQGLESFDPSRPLAPWLFRIAHHGCVDFLRRRSVRREAESALAEAGEELTEGALELVAPLERAVEHLVLVLPPKERACVLLKDVLDYSLEEIAELVDSTVGGVKAALNRGRTKLAALPEDGAMFEPSSAERSTILALYVERFNERDWDGLRELISADAQLKVADRYRGKLASSPYFSTYAAWPRPWRLTLGQVEGQPVVVVHLLGERGWQPEGVVSLEVVGEQIVSIADYLMCGWVLSHAASLSTGGAA
ncbi:MAG: sigma-70 family RNA polymerase sigma factor [Myxococcales bacterium]|nr:MAG: sigma-70 family RNA polymerase sigma factor [Myxococcales bacterium]